MKLNLLPTTVSKGRQATTAILFSAVIAIVGLVLGGYLAHSSQDALDTAKSDQAASTGPAQEAYKVSADADTIMGQDISVDLIKDATLATDMIQHNDVYPDLYDSIKPYIPPFYRINSISATPAGQMATVTMVGTLDTYQQYANLMLAFSRYPGLVSISRSGYIDRDDIVPAVNLVDEVGKPRKPDAAPIPDDKLERLAYFQANAQPPAGYTGAENFGSGTDNTRGAMPTSSLVTVTMTILKDLQVPDPRATLAGGGGGGAGGGIPGGGGAPRFGPGGTGGAPGAGTAPGASAAGTGGGKGGKKGAADDEGG